MAVYRIRKDSLFLTEFPMYGEKRLGVIKENKFLMKKPTGNNVSFGVINFTNFSLGKQNGKQTVYPLGKKHYESTDWLGNVRVTYTDKKSWQQNKFALNVSSSQDYYPFGAVMEGRNLEITNYRFGFQGQEGDDEVFGKNNLWAYKYRLHDARLGRFFSVDPLADKYPYNSVYAFSENRVISFIELEGSETITFQTYSFAPFESFGFGFTGNGENRKFGDKIVHNLGKENYKIGAEVKIDLTTDKVLKASAYGSLSEFPLLGVKAYSEADFDSFDYSKGVLQFTLSGNNDAFFWGLSADIDVHAIVGFYVNNDKKELYVTGFIFGDKFPANETFLTDESGAKVFLGVSGASGNPYTSLPGYGHRDMSKFSFKILLDEKGNFKTVQTMDGRKYSLEEWNKFFENLNPQDGNVGTNVE